ncbi:MAG TPA: hypothetical protein VKU41_27550 [Polyangiaceae bacterium]|nr:hypothetical protein [Polyangiaceae bacterium]
MRFDPVDAAAHVSTSANFERLALEFLERAVGYDVAFMGLRGASMTSVGLARDTIERAVRPGSKYEIELAPVKQAALAARYVAVDTEAIGGVMLGRTGGPFRKDDVGRVADLLPALAVGRASYGLPGLMRAPLRPTSPVVRWPWGGAGPGSAGEGARSRSGCETTMGTKRWWRATSAQVGR